MIDRHGIQLRWEADGSRRDERGRRLLAASEARAAGRGGIAAVCEITGLARSTIGRGPGDLDAPPPGQVRRPGGGPRLLTDRDPSLLDDLKRLVEPVTRGDPEVPLLWVSKSLGKLAVAIKDMGHTISPGSPGSNGARVKLWKVELQGLAGDETGLTLQVHHYPPGTSKWNKIEHRLFCHITQNWRGRPLTDRMTVVELIGATTTKAGLRVQCAIDERIYHKGIKVSNTEMAALDITGDEFHPEWNYTIKPRTLET